MPSCLVVQHIEPEGAYAIGDALVAAGVTVDIRRVFAGETLPRDISKFDGLVIMGGPMSARSDQGFITRGAEIELLAQALDREIPSLGICLGAQLLAIAAGGLVSSGTAGAEIGWGPINLMPAANADPLLSGIPDRLSVLHWHGETFELPQGATPLASNERYANQAFRMGRRAWGFQFHVEVDRQAVMAFLAAFDEEARNAGSDPEAIIASTDENLDQLAPVRNLITSRFSRLVSGVNENQLLSELN